MTPEAESRFKIVYCIRRIVIDRVPIQELAKSERLTLAEIQTIEIRLARLLGYANYTIPQSTQVQ